MKKIIKITLVALVVLMTMSLFGCSAFERIFLGGDPYSFSDIVLTQTGITEYKIEFTVDCGKDDVSIYFTEGSRLKDTTPKQSVTKTVDGKKARFSFTKELILGENYYLWVVNGDKQAKISIPAPSMFPSITQNEDGSATFNFNYTYGTAWDAFCDPNGKAVYSSASQFFDDTAVLIVDGIEITEEHATIPAEQYNKNNYYFSVSTAKDGMMKVIARPVTDYSALIDSIDSISAKLTTDLTLEIKVAIPTDFYLAGLVSEYLQLVIRTAAADEVYVVDCVYAEGVATMSFDCTQLIFDGLWYDMLFAWNGNVVMDVPKVFEGRQVVETPSVKKDGIIYNIVDWKPDGAPETEAMLKVYFEEDTTRYADEILRSYIVTFDAETATLKVVAKIRSNVDVIPVLAITAGDKTILESAEGELGDDGFYYYTLKVDEALTEPDKWYDLRFFVNNTAYEMLKDSCITYADFATKYVCSANGLTYEFREYNGMLKLMFNA